MKITELGYRATGVYSFKCSKCGCEFEWTDDDVGEIAESLTCLRVIRYMGIVCPCCGTHIGVDTLRLESNKRLEPYTKNTVYSKEAYQKYMEEKNKK